VSGFPSKTSISQSRPPVNFPASHCLKLEWHPRSPRSTNAPGLLPFPRRPPHRTAVPSSPPVSTVCFHHSRRSLRSAAYADRAGLSVYAIDQRLPNRQATELRRSNTSRARRSPVLIHTGDDLERCFRRWHVGRATCIGDRNLGSYRDLGEGWPDIVALWVGAGGVDQAGETSCGAPDGEEDAERWEVWVLGRECESLEESPGLEEAGK